MITKEIENRIKSFVSKYGNGKKGLTEQQKNNRIEKVIGDNNEIEKVKTLGVNKSNGVDIKTKIDFPIPEEYVGEVDRFKDIIKDLDKYPKEQGKSSHRIIYIKVKDNGEIEYDGIIKDGTEKDMKTRKYFGVSIQDDKTSAKSEKKQYEKGTLKEVSDRTMEIHKENGDLDNFINDSKINTREDKQFQI